MKKVLISLFLVLLAACTTPNPLPLDAQAALSAYWDAIPTGDHDLKIVRAWQGEYPVEAAPEDAPTMEIWCVETAATDTGGLGISENLVWFVTRPAGEGPWSAGLLMAMSSIWPYQACGVGP